MASLVLVLAACDGADAPTTTTTATTPSAPVTPPPETHAPVVVAPPPKEAVASPSTPEQFVGRHVLVAAGTPLRVAPKPDATALLLEAEDGGLGARAFAVTGHEAGMLKLELAKAQSRCDDGVSELADIAPALYVEPERVASVLAREAVVRAPDGTSVRLRPGVAIEQSGPNGIVDAGGIRLEVAIDPLDVGRAFTPAMAPMPSEAPHRVPRDARLRYGDAVVAADEAWFADGGGVLVLSRRDEGDDAMIEVLNACATVQARLEPRVLADDPRLAREEALRAARSAGILGSMMTLAQYVVPAGAPMVWPDGTPAVTRAHEQRFADTDARKVGRSLVCFMHAKDSRNLAPFELCVKPRHAKREDPFAALVGAELSASEMSHALELGLLRPLDDDHGAVLGVRGDLGGDVGGVLGGGGFEDGGGGIGGIGEPGGGSLSMGAGKAVVRVSISGVTASGGLDGKAVRSELSGLSAAIRYCAEAHIPTATGSIAVTLRVGTDGVVRDATASGVESIDDCVQRSVEGLSLPTAADETSVSFTVKVSRE